MFSETFLKSGLFPVAVSLATFISPINTKAQTTKPKAEPNFFQRTNIVFSVTPTYSFKGKTQLITGDQNLHTQNLISAEAGVGLVFNLSDNFGIKSGLQVGATPLDFGYDLNSNYDSILGYQIKDYASYSLPFDREYFGYLNIPLQFEYRERITDRKYFLGAAGINLKWIRSLSTHYGFGSTLYDTTNVYFLEIYTKQATKNVTIPLSLSAGIGFVLKNKNMLVLNVKSEIGFTNLINGAFAFFPNEPYQSVGTYTKNGSYVGLEIGYRLTKARQLEALDSPTGYTFAKNEGHINQRIDSTDFQKIFRRNQIGINLGYQINLAPIIETEKGDKPDITGLPIPMLSADYIFNVNQHWNIKTGLEMGAIIYQYNNVNYFDTASNTNYLTEFYHYEGTYSLNVALDFRCRLSRNIFLESNAGLNTTRLFDGGATYAQGFDFNYPFNGQNYTKGSSSDKFLFGSKMGLGLLFANKNYNLWRIGLDYKYSFSAASTENYTLNKGYENEQTGTVKSKGNYIALSAGYVYSFSPSPYAITTRRMKIETSRSIPKVKLSSDDLKSIYTKNQLSITSELNFMMRPEVSINKGATFNVYTYPKLGLSADYIFNFNKNWAFKTGLCMSGYSYDVDNYILDWSATPGYSFESYNIIHTYGIKAGAICRKQISHSNLWYAGAGLSLKKYYGYGENNYRTTDASSTDRINSVIKSNGIISGADFETGILLTAKNYNQWKFGVTYFQSFTPLVEQDYSFNSSYINEMSSGAIVVSGSYFGINAGYVFSFKKREKY